MNKACIPIYDKILFELIEQWVIPDNSGCWGTSEAKIREDAPDDVKEILEKWFAEQRFFEDEGTLI